MSDLIIQTENLTRIYGSGELSVTALSKANVRINAGEFVAIMGPSGSGKSTLMNILGCLDRATTGRYVLNGIDISNLTKLQLAAIRNQQLGFIFQSYNLLAGTTALRNVMLPLIYQRGLTLNTSQREAKALAALELVGLSDRSHHEPMALSGGQRQRVAIARALINDPALILADEPTGNLDSQSSHEIMNVLHHLHERGRTIVMVTHEPDIAERTERTIMVHDGQVTAVQTQRNGAAT